MACNPCSSPPPPPAPDYAGAAQAQGAANVDAARVQGKFNNPNVIGPTGTQTVTYGGNFDQAGFDRGTKSWAAAEAAHMKQYGQAIPKSAYHAGYQPVTREQYTSGDVNQPTITQKLSPEQQALYQQETANQQALGALGSQGIQSAQGVIGTKLDTSGAPAMPGSSEAIRDRVYQAMMSRPNQDLAVKRDNMRSDLVAAGIRPGSQAYDRQADLVNRQETDAQMQAVLAGGAEAQRNYGMDLQSRQQGLSEQLAQRQVPLNEITALMSGSQVSNPFQMPGYAQNAQVGASPLYGAAQDAGNYASDLYNAKAAGQGGMQSGLFGLGGAGIMGTAMVL